MNEQRSSVLACVTSQFDCDRIITTAKQIADDCGCELRVLSVLKPTSNYTSVIDRIEYLYLVSKQSDADMTILFDSNAPKAVAEFVKNNDVERIVTGMHDGGEESFLVKFNELAPDVSISMVSKENRVYSMDLCKSRA